MATPERQTVEANAQSPLDRRAPASRAHDWSALSRVAFVVCCAYFLFVWVPWTLMILWGIQWPFSTLYAIGQWPITNVLHLPEHSPSLTAADYLPNYLAALVVVVVSAAVAVVWALVDRRPANYSRPFVWQHTALRFMLAALLLSYGWHKVLPAQFGRFALGAGTDYFIHQVGQLPPRDLLWAFMEASRSYQVFTGLMECAAGLLLLTRRTAVLGALLGVADLTNVLMLNIGYDVSVKFFAGQMLLMALFVLAPYANRLIRVLALPEKGQTVQLQPFFARPTADRTVRVIGVLCAGLILVWTFRSAQATVSANRAIARSPLHGIWDVETITRNGVAVPLVITDETMWRRLVFPWEGATAGAMIVWMSDAVTRCSSKIDLDAKRIELEPLPGVSTVAGSVFGVPGASARERQSFSFSNAGDDHLVLHKMTPAGDALVIRLRKFDSGTYQLIAHKHEWTW
jgi:hypothetical protein